MINSAEEFVILRTSEVREQYSRAAEESAPTEVWLEVIEKFPDMKEWVVHNKTVPLEILDMLARDPNQAVRASVADKRKLDVRLFELLSHDADEVVRQRIAYNKKTPLDVIRRLSLDESAMVRGVAKRRLAEQ